MILAGRRTRSVTPGERDELRIFERKTWVVLSQQKKNTGRVSTWGSRTAAAMEGQAAARDVYWPLPATSASGDVGVAGPIGTP